MNIIDIIAKFTFLRNKESKLRENQNSKYLIFLISVSLYLLFRMVNT
jgi:hypothetical protein